MSIAGSHRSGGIWEGRIHVLEGSCPPGVPETGGPPGIPGRPRPAEPNDFPRLELGMVPTPGTGVAVGPAGAEELVTPLTSAVVPT
jgi:hypothetical protein